MSSKPRRSSRRDVAPQEDTQPNELLRKDRRNNAPPVIQLSKRGRTRKQTGRGRGVNNVPRTAPNKLPRSSQSSQQAQTDSPSFGTSASVSESAPTLGMDNSPQLPHMQPSSSPSHVHSILPTPVARPPSSSGGPVRPKRMSSPTKASAVVGAPNLADIIVATATSNLRRVSSHIKAPNSFSPSPSKRRKISVESPMQGPPSSGQEKSPSTAKGIKRERSLSPGSLPGSKLVTKGALRLSPLPQNCQPSHEDYEANRKVWRAIECANLRKKGLTVLRVLIRSALCHYHRPNHSLTTPVAGRMGWSSIGKHPRRFNVLRSDIQV